MKTPQAGDMWEWLDPYTQSKERWNAVFLLIKPIKDMSKMWKCLTLDSNEPGKPGTTCSMSFSETTAKGWTFIA